MRITRLPDGFIIGRLSDNEFRLLRRVPEEADTTGIPAAEDRLFPDPLFEPEGSVTEGEDSFLDDWHAYVRPDLQDEFDSAMTTFRQDVAKAERHDTTRGTFHTVRVPGSHAEAWFSALNQARLVMNEKYRFPEDADLGGLVALFREHKLEPFMQMRFYGMIQEWIVAHFMREC